MTIKEYNKLKNVFKFEYSLEHEVVGREKELQMLISEFEGVNQNPKAGVNVVLVTSYEAPYAEDVSALLRNFSFIIKRMSHILDVVYFPSKLLYLDRIYMERDIVLRILMKYYANKREIVSFNERFCFLEDLGWDKIIKAKRDRHLIIVMNSKLVVSPSRLEKMFHYLNQKGISFLLHIESDLWENGYKDRLVEKINKEIILRPLDINTISQVFKKGVDLIFTQNEFPKDVFDIIFCNVKDHGIRYGLSLLVRCKKYLSIYPEEKLTGKLVSELLSMPGGDENAIALMKMTPEEREKREFLAF